MKVDWGEHKEKTLLQLQPRVTWYKVNKMLMMMIVQSSLRKPSRAVHQNYYWNICKFQDISLLNDFFLLQFTWSRNSVF